MYGEAISRILPLYRVRLRQSAHIRLLTRVGIAAILLELRLLLLQYFDILDYVRLTCSISMPTDSSDQLRIFQPRL